LGRRGPRLTDEEKKERQRGYYQKWRTPTNLEKERVRRAARYAANPEKKRTRDRAYRKANPQWVLFTQKRARAKSDGVLFKLVFEDIWWPSHCPALGIPLNYNGEKSGFAPHSPSFDRIDPTRGYVPDNVLIISNRANKLKSNATTEELEALVRWVRSLSVTSQHGDTVS